MGLENGVTLDGGVELNDSYLKIGDILIDKISNDVTVSMLGYKDKSTRDVAVSNVLNLNIKKKLVSDDPFYISDILPAINVLKGKLYLYLKNNGFSNFSDI